MNTPARRQRAGAPGLPAPPWIRVRRMELIRRQVREMIPTAHLALLLQKATQVFEGEVHRGPNGQIDGAYGTLMLTIDLHDTAPWVAERRGRGAAAAMRIAALLVEHDGLSGRLRDRMRAGFADLIGADERGFSIAFEYTVRAHDHILLIDADGSLTIDCED